MSSKNQPQFTFVSAGRRSREVHEEYPAEMTSLCGSAEGLVDHRYFEKWKKDYTAERGVTVVKVEGAEWRDFLTRKPGWQEIPLDPGEDFFKPAERTTKLSAPMREKLQALGLLERTR